MKLLEFIKKLFIRNNKSFTMRLDRDNYLDGPQIITIGVIDYAIPNDFTEEQKEDVEKYNL
jgi:hypothetical protein